ncbi:hypothetical protein D3C75_727880 [compost metagenome]
MRGGAGFLVDLQFEQRIFDDARLMRLGAADSTHIIRQGRQFICLPVRIETQMPGVDTHKGQIGDLVNKRVKSVQHGAVPANRDDDFRRFGIQLQIPLRCQLVKLLRKFDGQFVTAVQNIISQDVWLLCMFQSYTDHNQSGPGTQYLKC